MSSSVPALQGSGDPAVGLGDVVPDPAARPARRSFTAEYRARTVAEYEAAPHGQKAAVLRREGLFQSQIREWMAARDALGCGTPVPRRLHRARRQPPRPARRQPNRPARRQPNRPARRQPNRPARPQSNRPPGPQPKRLTSKLQP